MGLWRTADNPWGQEVLIGISWTLMWVAIVAGVAFCVGHWAWLRMRGGPAPHGGDAAPAPADLPERIERHSMAARVFHWTMAISMLALLITAFVPVMGLQFPWVTIHWLAGVLLVLAIVWHIVHSIGWQDFWSMMSVSKDVQEGMAQMRHVLSASAPRPDKTGKYPFDHRMYHHSIVVVSFGAMITGVLMMVRVDTPFWTRNPYLFSDATWGVMYVIHGLSGVALITLVSAHIYFAIRPEKRWITWSMIRGWVDREHYLAHHDPAKWVVSEQVSAPESGGAIAESVASAPREDA